MKNEWAEKIEALEAENADAKEAIHALLILIRSHAMMCRGYYIADEDYDPWGVLVVALKEAEHENNLQAQNQ
jgi:hypothetical protein